MLNVQTQSKPAVLLHERFHTYFSPHTLHMVICANPRAHGQMSLCCVDPHSHTESKSFKQGSSDILFPSHILQLLLGDPEVIPGRMFNPSPSRKHHDQIHEPPQLAALNAKEQWFYTELFLDV